MRRNDRADAMLHPQRLAIVRVLARGPHTAKQLAAALPDLAQATLYRHLGTLSAAGLVRTVEERAVRGTVERTFALADSAIVTADELGGAGREDHFRYFATFLSALLGDYGRYLDRDTVDLEADGVGFREHPLNLSDDELRTMLGELREVIGRWSGLPAEPGRRARLLATITLPTDTASAAAQGGDPPPPAGTAPYAPTTDHHTDDQSDLPEDSR